MRTRILLVTGSVTLLVVLLGTQSGVSYQRALDTARERIENLGSQIVETPCGSIEYAITGAGYPVLVVHGIAGGFDQGLGLAHAYLDDGFRVIAPSRFGYLRSPLPERATPAMQADAYACLLDSLGIPQAALVTTSAGATSSIQFALRHPDRASALILHSPNAPGKVDFALPPRPAFNALIHSDFSWWVLSTHFSSVMQSLVGVPKGFSLTPEYDAEVKATLTEILPISARADGMLFDTFVSNPDINTDYPFGEVKTPTFVVSAIDDPMALHENARRLATLIPGARLLAVADGGHMMLGHEDQVRTEITGFLRSATVQAGNTQ